MAHVLEADRGGKAGADLQRDFAYSTDGTFAVDLPGGTYNVTLLLGDASTFHDNVAVYLEGALVDTVTTPTGGWVTRTYTVALTDGQLTLRLRDLGGADFNWALNALQIVTAPSPSPSAS